MNLVHPAVREQLQHSQPSPLLIILWMAVMGWGPSVIARLLLLSSRFNVFAYDHPNAYGAGFLLVQLVLLLGTSVFILRRFRHLVWSPKSFFSAKGDLLLGIPMFSYQLFKGLNHIFAVERYRQAVDQETFLRYVDALHSEVWSALQMGPSLLGVIGASIFCVTFPVAEELLSTGLLGNVIGRRFGIVAMTLFTPVCFAVIHIPRVGLGSYFVWLFCLGFTCMAARLMSGDIRVPIFLHTAVNLAVFLPKWFLAAAHFIRTP